MSTSTYTETDYLKDEVERYRQAEQDRIDDERRQREQKERDWRERAATEERSADNWPEALRKQAILFRREARQWTDEIGPDDFFGPGAKACDRALEIWKEIALEKKTAIEELEAQLALVMDSIRTETADRLEGEFGEPGWKHVAQAIRTENPENWLYW